MWSRPCPSSVRPASDPPGQSGRATLELLVVGMAVFIPVLLLAVSLWSIQRAQLASEAAARHAVRTYTVQTQRDTAATLANQAVAHALSQHGVEGHYRASLRCFGGCLAPGSWAEVTVSVQVPLGRIPLLPVNLPLSVSIASSASAQVSVYRGAP